MVDIDTSSSIPAGSSEENPEPLTQRETAILTFVERGYPNKRIAQELGIGLSTVKLHVSKVLGKLGLRQRWQAIQIAELRAIAAVRQRGKRRFNLTQSRLTEIADGGSAKPEEIVLMARELLCLYAPHR